MKLSPKPLLAGMAVYFGMSAGTYIYVRSTKPPQSCDCQQLTKDGDMDVYERLADEYDNKIGFDETVMGIKLLRWWLIHKLEGNVLEVSAGTGRNLPYYNFAKLSSLTLTDTSRQMLINAQEKYKEAREGMHVPCHTRVSFCLCDGHRLVHSQEATEMPSPKQAHTREQKDGAEWETRYGPALRTVHTFPPGTFDAVVDTFGLCSHEDPVQVLKAGNG